MEIWALKNGSSNPMEMLKQGEFDSRIDLELLVGKIVQVCGAMSPVYNTTESYTYFHKQFFKMWKTQISKLLDTMEYEYEPLENYRRVEDLKSDTNENTSGNESGTDKSSNSSSSSSTVETKTSAYNESVYQPERQETENAKGSGSSNSENSRQYSQGKTSGVKEDNTIRGLNGLFTTQQLIEQERKVAEFNVYQWIVNKYMEELFICVF